MPHVLLTGGAGYIGSHTALALLEAGFEVSVVDNLSNSSEQALHRVRELAGKDFAWHLIDLRDQAALAQLFATSSFDAVIHFAGLKAVGESVAQPLRYYDNNLNSTISLLQCMQQHRCQTLIFSSSATVYGDAERVPITEQESIKPTNTYGRSKAMIEQMLFDLARSEPGWCISILRYFNPVGAHPSGRIGEDPKGIPNNLMPVISQVACGKLEQVQVFGTDYPTPDGSGVRDYIHVQDLAEGHLRALLYLQQSTDAAASQASQSECRAVNLGTGRGYSVLEMLAAYQSSTGVQIKHQITAPRPGDVATCYADPSLAQQLFNWQATRSIETMCTSTHNWQTQNPRGYE